MGKGPARSPRAPRANGKRQALSSAEGEGGPERCTSFFIAVLLTLHRPKTEEKCLPPKNANKSSNLLGTSCIFLENLKNRVNPSDYIYIYIKQPNNPQNKQRLSRSAENYTPMSHFLPSAPPNLPCTLISLITSDYLRIHIIW